MIDRQTIEDFVKLMVEHDLVELDLADGDQSIHLRRAEPGGVAAAAPAMPMPSAPPPTAPATGGHAAPVSDGTKTIDSPMVGTFYSRPNPDSDAFVNVGAKVTESTVVCLIEAMKVFNEIKAECRGEIVEVLVNDGDAVEYGQPLFRVKPA